MNKRWCEGLDWVRVTDLLEIAPGVYTEMLRRQLESMCDVHGKEADRKLRDEIERRLREPPAEPARLLSSYDDWVECVVEATRLCAEDAERDYELTVKLLRKSALRVVK